MKELEEESESEYWDYEFVKGQSGSRRILITIFLFVFIYAQPAAAYWQTPQQGTYQNILVQVAHEIIEEDNDKGILILDVRYQCEHDLGRLYGAVLMPYDQLQENISKFQTYKNQVIIVYCKTEVRSEIASEILANNGFTRVYNMEGGILAWINAGYQIYTTYHYATVNRVDDRILTHIEPLLPLQTGPPPCTQNKTCGSSSEGGNVTNFQFIVLEQDENYLAARVTYEVNGTTFEFTVNNTLLWSFNEVTDRYNRTARFSSTEITGRDSFTQFNNLGYSVHCEEYNLTIRTVLSQLNSEAYNTSFTDINCVPAGKSGLVSLEFVDFNASVTLSNQYAISGKVAQKIGKLYKQSRDTNLTRLTPSYHYMSEEAGILSKLVGQQLREYDREILDSSAILADPSPWDCFFGWLIYSLASGAIAFCAIITVGFGLLACLGSMLGLSLESLLASAIMVGTIAWGCIMMCCCMGYAPCCAVFGM